MADAFIIKVVMSGLELLQTEIEDRDAFVEQKMREAIGKAIRENWGRIKEFVHAEHRRDTEAMEFTLRFHFGAGTPDYWMQYEAPRNWDYKRNHVPLIIEGLDDMGIRSAKASAKTAKNAIDACVTKALPSEVMPLLQDIQETLDGAIRYLESQIHPYRKGKKS